MFRLFKKKIMEPKPLKESNAEKITYPQMYLSELIDVGIINETTEAYKAWREVADKYSRETEAIRKPYREALIKAQADFDNAVKSLPPYPSAILQPLWDNYVQTSHRQGFPVWGIDNNGREQEIIAKQNARKLTK